MFKPAIAAAATIIIAGSSIVHAQQDSGSGNANPGTARQRGEQGYRLSAEDMAAFTDARIAALRAGLQLTPEQSKNWPAFEQALRDAAELRMQYVQVREAREQQEQPPEQGQGPANTFARMEQRADNLAKLSEALKKIAETGVPLYQGLTDAQKHVSRFSPACYGRIGCGWPVA